jgi:hypothetical protein
MYRRNQNKNKNKDEILRAKIVKQNKNINYENQFVEVLNIVLIYFIQQDLPGPCVRATS